MPRNGNGDYDLPSSNPVVPGTEIDSDWANETMSDLGAALSGSIAADGQTTPLNNLPMGGFHHTSVSDPTLRNQYSTLGMVQDGRHQRVSIISGTNNLIGSLVGQGTTYVAGAIVSFFAPEDNTGPMTLNYNGIGARSIVSANQEPLTDGDISAGGFYVAVYNGSAFVLVTAISASRASSIIQATTSGWIRPVSGLYPTLTIATADSVNIPAGSSYIVPAGDDGLTSSILVEWDAQTITLSYLNSSFSTTIAVDVNGVIVQFAGRVTGSVLRGHATLGVVEHIGGAANAILTKPSIFGDDGYGYRDASVLLQNSIMSGMLVSGNSVAGLQLDSAGGEIYQVGGTPNQADNPNLITVPQQASFPFWTVVGQGATSGPINTAPVEFYDQDGSGTLVQLSGNDKATIHRIYYLYGQYLWVYGQVEYNTLEDAILRVEIDRSTFTVADYLNDATWLAEVIATRNCIDLSDPARGAIIARGGAYFSIGSSGGIGEAPTDGTPYGRQDAGWTPVLSSTNPSVLGATTITGSSPQIIENMDPVVGGVSGTVMQQLGLNWVGIEADQLDDTVYFRSYDPSTGNVRNEATWDLATGEWAFPNITDAANTVKQDSDTGSAALPVGDTDQRSTPEEGRFRYNSELGSFEGANGTSWAGVGGASGGGGNPFVYENDINVITSYDITSGKNAMSAGPIAIPVINYALWSEDFTNAVWEDSTASWNATGDDVEDPDGGMTADTITTAINTPLIRQQTPLFFPTGGVITVSFWAKVLSSVGDVTLSTDYGNGTPVGVLLTTEWVRYSVQLTISNANKWLDFETDTIVNDEVSIWGVQLQSGDVVTSYNKTESMPMGATVSVPDGSTYTIV